MVVRSVGVNCDIAIPSFFVTAQKYESDVTIPIVGGDAREIASSIEDGVRLEKISQEATLPTVRALAASLKGSPTTVVVAYRTLRQRGWLSA